MTPTFQYAGYYAHQGTGLNLTWYRAYDPVVGRWLSRDPIGENGGINIYDYCLNSPINEIDPFGLDNLNLFPPGSQQFKNINTVQSPPGTYTVGGHGNPWLFAVFSGWVEV